jgi:hypothetical protein
MNDVQKTQITKIEFPIEVVLIEGYSHGLNLCVRFEPSKSPVEVPHT